MKKGFSIIEIIVALGLFSIFVGIGSVGIIPSLYSNRQSAEYTSANDVANEGLEAVRSLRDQNFANIVSGTFGIGISNSLWKLTGSSDVVSDFTRRIDISKVSRDTGGTQVVSGGSTDPDSFKVTSTVDWKYTSNDTKSISVSTILTNWRKTMGSTSDGLILFSNGTVGPKWRSFNNTTNTFGVGASIPVVSGSPRNFILRTSPQKNEAIAGIANSTGILYVYCFDGTTWTQDWSATVGGTATTRRFDIAYENTTGDAVVLYSTNTTTTNELNFRTKLGTSGCGGTNWSAATAFDPVRTSGLISWVKMNNNPITGSNLIAAVWADWNKDLSGAIWNGTTFANEMTSVGETSLEAINIGTSFPDVESFDLAYESVAGDLMTIWGISTGSNGVGGVRYRLCTGNSATCTWGAVTTPPTWADDATNLDLSANPNSDEMVFASIGNAGSDLQMGYWSGVGWTNTANVDITSQAPLAGTKLVATGWLTSGATTRSIVTYNKSATTTVNWYTGNRGVFSVGATFIPSPLFANPQKWYEIATNSKSKDQLMFTLSDNASDLHAKRLVMTSVPGFTWTNSSGGSAVELNLSQSTVKPFGFAWWQK